MFFCFLVQTLHFDLTLFFFLLLEHQNLQQISKPMAQLMYDSLKPHSNYKQNKSFKVSKQEYQNLLQNTQTLYVGNLSFQTTQENLYHLFSLSGNVKRIIMGINDQGLPCGFCFVEFQTHQQAGIAVQFISGTKLDGRIIRVDWDPGYKQGRQKGRGQGGYQKRDQLKGNNQDQQRQVPRGQKRWRGEHRQYRDRKQRYIRKQRQNDYQY